VTDTCLAKALVAIAVLRRRQESMVWMSGKELVGKIADIAILGIASQFDIRLNQILKIHCAWS